VLVLIAVAMGAWKVWLAPRPITIAVVLFHNETGDAANDQLAQQLTDGAVVALAANPRYAVIGNAAILRTPRIFADIHEIGEALRAQYLVLGQVQRAGDGLIVRAHFIRVSDQKHLWATGIPGEAAGLDSLVPQTVGDAVDAALGVRASPRR
jgi:TolB-like protein